MLSRLDLNFGYPGFSPFLTLLKKFAYARPRFTMEDRNAVLSMSYNHGATVRFHTVRNFIRSYAERLLLFTFQEALLTSRHRFHAHRHAPNVLSICSLCSAFG